LLDDISESEIISLAYNDPRIKPKTMQAFVQGCLDMKYPVEYLDFDLQFSSLLQNLTDSEFNRIFNDNLRVFQPSTDITDIVVPLSKFGGDKGLIIVDSLNTVQNLLSQKPTPTDLKCANHRAAVFLSALQQLARANSQTILALNLTKSRPRKSDEMGVIWEKEIVGGRMTRYKSDVILFANECSDDSQTIRIRITVDAIFSEKFKGNDSDEYEIKLD
jgi:hypothetical protein